jgi:hypothetical protein
MLSGWTARDDVLQGLTCRVDVHMSSCRGYTDTKSHEVAAMKTLSDRS